MIRDLLVLVFCFAAVLFDGATSQPEPSEGPSGDVDNHFINPVNASAVVEKPSFLLGDTVVLQWVTNCIDYTVFLIQEGEFARSGPSIYAGAAAGGSGTSMYFLASLF